MKIKYTIILISSLVLGFSVALANTDKKATSILNKVAQIKKSGKAMKGSFLYIFENKAENIQEKSKGYFIIKDEKYWVDILGVETFFDGKTISSFMKDANELTIQDPDDDEGGLTPSSLFDIYEKGFTSKYVGEKNEGNKHLYIVDLFPIDNSKNFKKVRAKIQKESYLPISVETFGKSGDNVRIEILDINTNTPNIEDSSFAFDTEANTDVEIIDMR